MNQEQISFYSLSLASQGVVVTFSVGVVVLSTVQIVRLLVSLFGWIWKLICGDQAAYNQVTLAGQESEDIQEVRCPPSGKNNKIHKKFQAQRSPLYLGRLKGHLERVVSVSVSSHTERIASCSLDNILRIFHINSVTQLAPRFLRIKLHKTVIGTAFGANSQELAVVVIDKNVSNLLIHNASTGQLIHTQQNILEGRICTMMTSSPTSPMGKPILITCAMRGYIQLFDFSGECYGSIVMETQKDINSCAISQNGRFICATNFEQFVDVWEVKVTKNKRFTGCQKAMKLQKHNANVVSCAFSPDSSRIATAAYDGLRIWSLDAIGSQSQHDQQYQAKLMLKMPLPLKQGECYQCLAWGHEKVIAGGVQGDVHFLNAVNGKFLDSIQNVHEDMVSQITIQKCISCETGYVLTTCGHDNQVYLFRLPQVD
eukprot:TRINITY_DN1566_c0_g3_i1.p1 TRINITY_DN1566_c0_g3~~TRINITY_DN1566_c0_g3_i1.p1  ORF type:complete len:427 (+),score=24.87 TRINITY_DN1566_c0_g3_i1:170-1450(+)